MCKEAIVYWSNTSLVWNVQKDLLQAYEARLNPFAEFQQDEATSRVARLPMHERALLSGSKCGAVHSGDVFL